MNATGPYDDKSTLAQVMAWCLQATSHHMSQCRLSSLSPYGVGRPQWVNSWRGWCCKWGKMCLRDSFHYPYKRMTWWRHQIETFSALMALCAGNSPVTGEFPSQRPVTRSFDLFFDLHLNKHLWDWWFDTPSRSLWRHGSDNKKTTFT